MCKKIIMFFMAVMLVVMNFSVVSATEVNSFNSFVMSTGSDVVSATENVGSVTFSLIQNIFYLILTCVACATPLIIIIVLIIKNKKQSDKNTNINEEE